MVDFEFSAPQGGGKKHEDKKRDREAAPMTDSKPALEPAPAPDPMEGRATDKVRMDDPVPEMEADEAKKQATIPPTPAPTAPPAPEIKGIFSSKSKVTLGTGTTKRKSESTVYWFGKESEDGTIQLQELDEQMVPSPKKTHVDKAEFFQRFTLEPELWYKLVNQKVNKGDLYRKQDRMVEAQIEYRQATRIDEDNIRANFGLGMVYLAQEQKEKAEAVYDKIMDIDEAFDTIHKHLFNEFGINLRKKRLYDKAVKYYEKAQLLSGEDEHLLFNLARAWFAKGEAEKALDCLRKSLILAPDFTKAKALARHMFRQSVVPAGEENKAFFKELRARADKKGKSSLGGLLGGKKGKKGADKKKGGSLFGLGKGSSSKKKGSGGLYVPPKEDPADGTGGGKDKDARPKGDKDGDKGDSGDSGGGSYSFL